jgi:hypothetical protein
LNCNLLLKGEGNHEKYSRFAVAALLVVSVVLMSVSTVFADSSMTTWAHPTATANGKDVNITSTVLDLAVLPGTVNNDAGMILPVGFTTGSIQFGGNGIVVRELTSTETAKVCFSFPVYQYSWTGEIYDWTGTMWVVTLTTIVAPTGENSLYYSCSSKVSNGTYCLLISDNVSSSD